MKKFLLPACIALIAVSSCKKDTDNKERADIVLDTFPVTERLEGRAITFDTIPGQPGSITVSDNMYILSLYDSEHCVMLTDTDFNILGYTARRGSGPNEVMGIVGKFGQLDENGNRLFFEPYQKKLYAMVSTEPYSLTEFEDLSEKLSGHSPRSLIRTKDGNYTFCIGGYRYGLAKYDEEADSVAEWPLGIKELNRDEPLQYVASARSIDYSPDNGVFAEIYCRLPVVVFHDESGNVISTVRIGDMPDITTIDNDSPYRFRDARLTPNHIYIANGDSEDESKEMSIYVIDYDYNPVAELIIPYAQTIDVDVANRRLIAVDANSEEHNIMVYDLPDCIVNP